jgi:tellurite resistance protein TerC
LKEVRVVDTVANIVVPAWVWVAFLGGVLSVLALDLGVFNRKAHVVSVKEAAIWTTVWVTLGLAFAGVIFAWQGQQKGIEWLTGYVVEYSLAVDNIFVFVLVFSYFQVPAQYRHRVLFWGILGALVMRGAMIFLGAALIKEFHWILLFFGAFLLFTGFRMFTEKDDKEHVDLEMNPAVRFAKRFFKVSPNYDGQKFFTVENGMRVATPLFLVLVFIEFTDLIFAVDSIPAIFAITQDPFIVFTSNIMAILGLRSLYFLLADIVDRFVYLKKGLAIILSFVGVKLLLPDISAWITGTSIKIPTAVSLGVIVGVLAISVIASLIVTARKPVEIGVDEHGVHPRERGKT